MAQEGDRVTFGHPQGEKVSPGHRVVQADSEYQFLVGGILITAQGRGTIRVDVLL